MIRRTRVILLIFVLSSISFIGITCSYSQKTYSGIISKAREKIIPAYILDSEYLAAGSWPFALDDDLKLGNRILLEIIPKDTIAKYHIKSFSIPGEYTYKFDRHGNIIYEKWDAWSGGSNFKYEYNQNSKPVAIAMLTEENEIEGSAKYKYDKTGKLLQVGATVFDYYPDGSLKSVADHAEIERYRYDVNGNLIQINFDLKPGIMACGNRTSEWKGYYNRKKQLVKVEKISFPDGGVTYLKYSDSGILVKSITEDDEIYNTVTDYIYSDGLLAEKVITAGKEIYRKKYIYEFY